MTPVQVKLKAKYRPRGSNVAKKCGINGDHNIRKRRKRKVGHPIVRQMIKIIGSDMKVRWEEL